MGGERLHRAPVAATGIAGDRVWGLCDAASGRIASPGREKHFTKVPGGRARWTGDSVEISSDGALWAAPDDTAALAALENAFGFSPALKPFAPIGGEGFQPRDEHAPIHLLTTAAMRTLARDLPGSIIDERRFRPNVVVDWPDGADPMPEQGWIGRDIAIGNVVLRGREPCTRCGFIMIEQEDLPLDIELLRLVVKRYGRHFGIYCDVVSVGEIVTGDRVAPAA
ncbi:hypothetical protein IP69_15685 [Bosea sp. AAP35]|nr:hypothetical protein IP69_15685 [Bosea sp. AAP35]